MLSYRLFVKFLFFFMLLPFLISVVNSLGWGINGVLFTGILTAIAVDSLSQRVYKMLQAFRITSMQVDTEMDPPLHHAPYFQGQRLRNDLPASSDPQPVSPSQDYDKPKASYPEFMPPSFQ